MEENLKRKHTVYVLKEKKLFLIYFYLYLIKK